MEADLGPWPEAATPGATQHLRLQRPWFCWSPSRTNHRGSALPWPTLSWWNPPGPLSWGALPSSAHVGRCGRAACCPLSARWSLLEPQTFENISVSNLAITMAYDHCGTIWGEPPLVNPENHSTHSWDRVHDSPGGAPTTGREAVWLEGPSGHLKEPRTRRQLEVHFLMAAVTTLRRRAREGRIHPEHPHPCSPHWRWAVLAAQAPGWLRGKRWPGPSPPNCSSGSHSA